MFRYLNASSEEEDEVLVFQSLRQMREMCRQFKIIVEQLTSYVKQQQAAVLNTGAGEYGCLCPNMCVYVTWTLVSK